MDSPLAFFLSFYYQEKAVIAKCLATFMGFLIALK